jgi:hypothetical protein
MDGSQGSETLFISQLTHTCGNYTVNLNLYTFTESWSMVVDCVGRYAER